MHNFLGHVPVPQPVPQAVQEAEKSYARQEEAAIEEGDEALAANVKKALRAAELLEARQRQLVQLRKTIEAEKAEADRVLEQTQNENKRQLLLTKANMRAKAKPGKENGANNLTVIVMEDGSEKRAPTTNTKKVGCCCSGSLGVLYRGCMLTVLFLFASTMRENRLARSKSKQKRRRG